MARSPTPNDSRAATPIEEAPSNASQASPAASSSSSASASERPKRRNPHVPNPSSNLPHQTSTRPTPGGGRGRGRGGASSRGGAVPKKKDDRIDTVMRMVPGSKGDDGEKGESRWCETKLIKGKMYVIEDDELQLPPDEKGDEKVDGNGVLKGGREFKVPTFTSKMRSNPAKHFVLSIDAARQAGYRDSLYFFRRNPLIQKLSCNQAEKDALIAAGIISGNLKSRGVTICSARNVFKALGAKIIKDGKYVVDDYYEAESLAEGNVAGALAIVEAMDVDKPGPLAGEVDDLTPSAFPNLTHSSSLYHHNNPNSAFLISLQDKYTPFISTGRATFGGDGKPPYGEKGWDPSEKRKKPALHLTPQNWMLEYARATGEMNRYMRGMRKRREKDVKLGWEPEVTGEEWRDVEIDAPIGEDGEVLVSSEDEEAEETAAGTEDDGDMEVEENDDEEEVSTAPLSQVASTEQPIQIHGLHPPNSTLSLPSSRLQSNSIPPSRSQSPPRRVAPVVKRPSKRKLAARWTTTVKRRELCEKEGPKGQWDPYTGAAHVRSTLQPTVAEVVRVSAKPQLVVGEEGVEDEEREKKMRKVDRGSVVGGLSSLEVVIRDLPASARPRLLPGMWDFGAPVV